MDAEKNTSDFWQDHSLTFLEMAFRTDCRERLDKPDGYGKKVGDCGDTVEFFINLDGDILGTLAYDINGCLNTNACCNAIVSLAAGKTMDAAWEITPEQVSGFLEIIAARPFSLCRTGGGHLVSCPGQRPGEPAVPVEKIIPLTARAPALQGLICP
jgi:nitrogen fixation NifU-like protein